MNFADIVNSWITFMLLFGIGIALLLFVDSRKKNKG